MNGRQADAVQRAPVTALVACALLLAGLDLASGTGTALGAAGWLVGLLCGTGLSLGLRRGLLHHDRRRLGPADRVTLIRAVMVCGVAALTAASAAGTSGTEPVLTALAALALVLDAVDGRVARRTRTSSPFGASLDMEVDAFLVLVLSVHVALTLGWWVLLIGAARYLLLLASRAVPWLRRPVPTRYWSKVVAATQGVVLVVTGTGLLPRLLEQVALVVALGLLVESFGHQVWWLRTHQPQAAPVPAVHEVAA